MQLYKKLHSAFFKDGSGESIPAIDDDITPTVSTPEYKLHGHIGTWHMESVKDYSAMQGPAPDGFHVPLNSEWRDVKNIWTALGGGDFGIALKLPLAGQRHYSSASVDYVGSNGYYWSSSRSNTNSAYFLYFNSFQLNPQNANNRAYGFSVRCFKNTPVSPILPKAVAGPISSGPISPSTDGPTLSLWTATKKCDCIVTGSLYSGGTGGVTYVDLWKNGTQVATDNSGFISGTKDFKMQVSVVPGDVLTLGTSRGSSDSGAVNDVYVSIFNGWTTLYDGSSVATGAGIFWNSTDGLISLSGDGQTWITIQDKNLGATTVWNSGDTLSETNCGKYYQWGNNYGFPRTGTIANQSTTQVDASNYGPGNYYSSDTFIKYSGRWDSTDNGNLWGGVTGIVTHYVPRS